MESNRCNLYREVHKALRSEIFGVVREAGALDWTDPTATASFRKRAVRLTGLLETHTEHEDRWVMPLVAGADPELHRLLERTHPRLDGMVAELRDRVEGLRPGPDALHSGYELYLFIASFAGEYMLHIADEELRANPALWKHYDDETLRETEGRLIGSIPPEEMAVWLRLMLPAMNAVERAGLLAGVRSTIPPEAFEGCLAIAREALDPRDWSRLEADLAAAAAA